MKEIFEVVKDRVKTPYFGYTFLSLIALNWRGIFLLTISTGTPEERLFLFDSVTSIYTLLIFPIIVGVVVALVTVWLRYFFAYINKKPSELLTNLQLEAEHQQIVKKTDLEKARAESYAAKESELIERAKRDSDIANISNEETQNKLKAEIEKLRIERDQLSEIKKSNSINYNFLTKEAKELLAAASSDESGSILKSDNLSGNLIQANKDRFGTESSRSFSKYEAALEQLVNSNLVKSTDLQGRVFRLTHLGWEASEILTKR